MDKVKKDVKPIEQLQYNISDISQDIKNIIRDINSIKSDLRYIKYKLNDVTEDKPVVIKEKTQTNISTEKGWFW